MAVCPRGGGVGAEPAQGEGAGAEAAVDRIDELPDGDGLLEHPGQHGHRSLGGEVRAEEAGAHVGHPVHQFGHQCRPGGGHQESGLVGGHPQPHVRRDVVRGPGPVRGGGGEDGDPPGDLAFLPEPVGGALGELGHERVADGHRVGVAQVGDGLDTHRLQALGQPPGDAPDLGDGQGRQEPLPVPVRGLVPVDHPVRGGQLFRGLGGDLRPR